MEDPRLFECSNATGNFRCEEICSFSQEDLDEDDVMLLDAHSEVMYSRKDISTNVLNATNALHILCPRKS